MKLGLVQYNPAWENRNQNMKKIESLLSGSGGGFDLLILPEMTLTGFTMKASEFAESTDGESFHFYSELAKKNNSHILAGIIEKSDEKYFNTILHISKEGKLVSFYRKIHPFSFSTEDKYYAKGDKTVVTKIENWNTGLTICYDLRFPELYRKYGKERAELIVNIANWPVTRIEHWRTLLKARAIENQCYIAGVNRVGDDPKLKYNGYSSVFDPMGNEIITSENEEKILAAEISMNKVKDLRTQLPFLNDIHLI